jgi:hypothetical protein
MSEIGREFAAKQFYYAVTKYFNLVLTLKMINSSIPRQV